METSCCICWRGCVCRIRQCPCVRFRLSAHIQIHYLSRSKIAAFLRRIATVIALQLYTISEFHGHSTFAIARDFCRFLFCLQYKTFFQCSIFLFRCLLLRVVFYILLFLDSTAIPLFPIAIVYGFLAIPLSIAIKTSVFQCVLFQCIWLLVRFLFNYVLFLDSPATPLFQLRSFSSSTIETSSGTKYCDLPPSTARCFTNSGIYLFHPHAPELKIETLSFLRILQF